MPKPPVFQFKIISAGVHWAGLAKHSVDIRAALNGHAYVICSDVRDQLF